MQNINMAITVYAISNMLIFLLMGVDKLQAIRNKWRVSEKVLLVLGLISGGIGLLVGMIVFRHKIRKPIFWIVGVLAVAIHIYLLTILI